MKKIINLFAIIILIVSFNSCVDSAVSKTFGYGDSFKIEMVNCDGTVTKSWISTGKVLSEENTDGYYFKEESTGKLVEVTGNIVITEQ